MPGGQELLFILILVLILFGAKRMPDLARSLGKGVSEFKKAMKTASEEIETVTHDVKSAVEEESSKTESKKLSPPASSPQGTKAKS